MGAHVGAVIDHAAALNRVVATVISCFYNGLLCDCYFWFLHFSRFRTYFNLLAMGGYFNRVRQHGARQRFSDWWGCGMSFRRLQIKRAWKEAVALWRRWPKCNGSLSKKSKKNPFWNQLGNVALKNEWFTYCQKGGRIKLWSRATGGWVMIFLPCPMLAFLPFLIEFKLIRAFESCGTAWFNGKTINMLSVKLESRLCIGKKKIPIND